MSYQPEGISLGKAIGYGLLAGLIALAIIAAVVAVQSVRDHDGERVAVEQPEGSP